MLEIPETSGIFFYLKQICKNNQYKIHVYTLLKKPELWCTRR